MTESATETEYQPKPFLVRRRTVFTWLVPILLLAAVVGLRRDDGGYVSLAVGVLIVIAGEAVRFWANGYIAKDAVLTTGGPYAHVRNPLYFGSLLLAIGYGLVSGLGIVAVLAIVALFSLFHIAAIRYEESFLTAHFGSPYTDYTNKVPRIIPSLAPRTHGEGHYSWAQALSNREHISALFAVTFVVLLAACRYAHLVH